MHACKISKFLFPIEFEITFGRNFRGRCTEKGRLRARNSVAGRRDRRPLFLPWRRRIPAFRSRGKRGKKGRGEVENPRRSVDTYVRASRANRRNTMAARGCGRVDALLVVVGTHSTRGNAFYFILNTIFGPAWPPTFGRTDRRPMIQRSRNAIKTGRMIRLDIDTLLCFEIDWTLRRNFVSWTCCEMQSGSYYVIRI